MIVYEVKIKRKYEASFVFKYVWSNKTNIKNTITKYIILLKIKGIRSKVASPIQLVLKKKKEKEIKYNKELERKMVRTHIGEEQIR